MNAAIALVEGTGVELAGTTERAGSRRVGIPGATRGRVWAHLAAEIEPDWPPRVVERRLNLKALP